MPNPDTHAAVTEEDREAAADLEMLVRGGRLASEMREGAFDRGHSVQAFARHRLAAEARVSAREERLEKAVQALVDKLDLVSPKVASDAAFMAMRGFVYDGPTYGKELEALRAALHTDGAGS